MAYRKRTTRRRTTRRAAPRRSYTRSYSRRAQTRRRTTRRAPQTVKIVIEQAAPSLVNSEAGVLSARQVKPKKAAF